MSINMIIKFLGNKMKNNKSKILQIKLENDNIDNLNLREKKKVVKYHVQVYLNLHV